MKFIFYLGIGAIVLLQAKTSTTAPSIIAEDLSELKNDFTSRISDSAKKVNVDWGCERGTQCYELKYLTNRLNQMHNG